MKKIEKKLKEIYDDLEANVTRIFDRQDLHLVYDLAWHSVLQFKFMGTLLTRGWVESLVVGDTRCGKTKTAERLLRHYRAGEMGTGENTSLAGLMGGMQQINRQWSIIWGKIPRNDRKLVVIDEASNLPVTVIPEFATTRSEGIARITKIQTEQTYSRTRQVWISNPRTDKSGVSRPISAYDYGVLTIPELIGRQADIARFDVGIVVANGEVPGDVIFASPDKRGQVLHTFTSEISHNLIMWAWSRKPSDVEIPRESEQEIIHQSKNLAKKFHDSIPLIKLEEQPEKLCRLAVALAARLFSSPDGIKLLVLPEHAAAISSFLDRLYSKPTMGYDTYSTRLFDSETLKDVDKIKERIASFGKDFTEGMLAFSIIRQNIIEDLTGLDRDRVRALISFMVRKKCIKPEHTWYRKTTPFIRLLKRIESGAETLPYTEEF